MVDVVDAGIWLAGDDDTAGGEGSRTLAGFDDLGEALEAFAARAAEAANRVERGQASGYPGLVAGVLRYRAAAARAEVAGAAPGDAIRRDEARIGDGLGPLAHAAGVSREFLDRVLAGEEWAPPRGPRVRPPGSRDTPVAPVTTLATCTVGGQRISLVSYRGIAGGKCIAIERDGHFAASDVDVNNRGVDDQALVVPEMAMTAHDGILAVYGRVHDSVTGVYGVMKDGERVDWPVRDDPENQQHCFALIADSRSLEDIVAVAPTKSVSLEGFFDMWFRKLP